MALVAKTLTLDITPGAIPQVVNVSEYDENREYIVTLVDDGGTFTIPSGTTATIEGTIGGNGFSESATVSGNTITFTLSENMTAKAGDVWCKIKLTKASKPIQTAAFILRCDRAGVEADTVIGASGFEEQIQNAVNDYLEDVVIDDSVVAGAVDEWLDNHPEATTTVQDGSLTEAKFTDALKLKTIKDYVTPEMFGAKGDGVTDDTQAFQALSGKTAYIPEGTYVVSHVEYARKTILCGAGMGKTIIKQKVGENSDMIDFVDADCSGMTNMSLYGNKSESSSDRYRALLKIRTTRDHAVDFSNYCNFEHLVIRNAPASGLVLLGLNSQDPVHPLSNYNWVHHFNDLRIEECNCWCMIDETTDNLFSNLYLNEGDLGNLYCNRASSNMYVNIKLDQPYGGGGSGTLEGFNDGCLILLNNCSNNRFVNIDLQSAYYVGAKIYNCVAIHFDGDINNCGLGANGHGIGLLIEQSSNCTFNLEFHRINTYPEYNVKINKNCTYISVFANERYVTENPNACPDTCFVVDPANITNLYNSTIHRNQKMNNLFANPLCDSLSGWETSNPQNISIDTNSKTAGTNSFKIVGDPSTFIQLYQRYTGLKEGDCYMALAVINVERLPTQTSPAPMYTVMATGGEDSRVYTSHASIPRELGKHLIAHVGKISSAGDLGVRFYAYKNDGVYYIGNFMLFNLTDLGIAIPAKPSTYNTLYENLKDIMDVPFDTVDVTWDYTQIMGILKYIVGEIEQ